MCVLSALCAPALNAVLFIISTSNFIFFDHNKRTLPNSHLESVLKGTYPIKLNAAKTYYSVLSRIMRSKFVVNL